MTIERNSFVRLAAKVLGKERVYEVHNRYLNRRFENAMYDLPLAGVPIVKPIQALTNNGIFVTKLQDLSFSEHEIRGLSDEYHAWADALVGFSGQAKYYEHKMNAHKLTVLDPDSWLYRIGTDERLAKIVRSYFGGKGCSLFYADYWHTVPIDGERKASQNWHRDNEDSRLLKVFIYLNDVDENNGFFEFLTKTSNGLEYAGLEPKFRVTSSRAASQETLDFISSNEGLIFKGIAKRGDVIFCDTTGFHRGGFVKEGHRNIVHFIYTSHKCPHVFYSVKDQNGKKEKIEL